MGGTLHLSSTLLVSLLNLAELPEESGRSAASVRAAREQKKLEEAWRGSTLKGGTERWRGDPSMEKYSQWLEKDAGKRKEDQGLLGQTILEEEDGSDVGL